MNWSNGSFYRGAWHKGCMHGRGCLTTANGVVKEGFFRENKYLGKTAPDDMLSDNKSIDEEEYDEEEEYEEE